MQNANSANYLKSTKDLGQFLTLLTDHVAHEPNSPISIHPGLECWQKNLFEMISSYEDTGLSEGVLRVVLKATFERDCDEEMSELLRKNFFAPEWGAPNYTRKYIKKFDRVWEFALSIVEILIEYSNTNGLQQPQNWQEAIPHEEFSEYVDALFKVTRGHSPGNILPWRAVDWIKDVYTAYDAYENISFAMHYIKLHTNWIAERFPKGKASLYPGLFALCADLTRYRIDLPNEAAVGPPNGISAILKWSPEISLKYLCKSYNRSVPDSYVFDDTWLLETVSEISELLPGKLKDQLLGIYHTNTDMDVQKGALALIDTLGV